MADRPESEATVGLEALEPRLLLSAAPDYLIVAGHGFFNMQGEACAAIQELADWKRLKGLTSQIVDMASIGTDMDALRMFIAAGTLDPNAPRWDPQPKYVLLIGDAAQVPPESYGAHPLNPESVTTHVADVPYVNWYWDSCPDAAIGRLPVSTEGEAEAAIAKILAYDRTPYVPQGDADNWYDDALVAACLDDYDVATDSRGSAQESAYWFMSTAHYLADYLGQDFDYWPAPGEEEHCDPHNQGVAGTGYAIRLTAGPGLVGATGTAARWSDTSSPVP